MGVRGAWSLLSVDPNRFCETLRFNWDVETTGSSESGGSDAEQIIFLVDGMALLYHVVIREEDMVHASPATVKDCVSGFIWQLVQVAGSQGAVHVFLDGLSPSEKIPTQVSRMKQQAINGDVLARGDAENQSARVLHLLAEWSLVEAVEGLMKHPECPEILFLYRSSKGEGEAYINTWIEREILAKSPFLAKVAILSDDTDILVYPSCPGFVPFRTIKFEQRGGQLCMQGQHFLRSKFLKAYIPTYERIGAEEMKNIMTAIAAIVGCDYVLGKDQESALSSLRKEIVESDIGGLRLKVRKSQSASSTLLATLRYVNHHIQKTSKEDGKWMKSMMSQFSDDQQQLLTSAFARMHKIYFRSLVVSTTATRNAESELNPGTVDVKRMFEYGVVYCYPVIETWKRRRKDENPALIFPRKRSIVEATGRASCDVVDSPAYAIITCPPCTWQIAAWISRSSIWFMPHFRQIRTRLYCLTRLVVVSGRTSVKEMNVSKLWIDGDAAVTEYVRVGSDKSIDIEKKRVGVPNHEYVSIGLQTSHLLQNDIFTIDRALLFCVLGNTKQAVSVEKQPAPPPHGTLFLASLTLPFNLACLLILMGTAPSIDFIPPPTSAAVCSEVNRVLPLLSVACYHALLLTSAVKVMFGDVEGSLSKRASKDELTTLATEPFVVSDTIRHDNALLIWQVLRLGEDLEEVEPDDTGSSPEDMRIHQYLHDAFVKLAEMQPNDLSWARKITAWKRKANLLWLVWWEMFNIDHNTEKNTPI